MTNSNTSLELKLSLELKSDENAQTKTDIGNKGKTDSPKLKDGMQADFEESVKENIFWKMHLKRKAGLEVTCTVLAALMTFVFCPMQVMNQTVEELAKECRFWKQQLDALNYQNRCLTVEKRSMTDDYEELLEKTRHDTGIIMKLKDSKRKLDEETKEFFKTDRRLTTLHYINTDLASDRHLLEVEKDELLKCLQKNTAAFERLNKIHKRIQSRIEKEQKRGESKRERYEQQLRSLTETTTVDAEAFENFKRSLADREFAIEDLQSQLADEQKEYVVGEQNDVEEWPENLNEEEKSSEAESSAEVKDEEKEKSKVKVVQKKVSEKEPSATEKEILVEWRKRKFFFRVAQKENSYLSQYYAYLNSRMNSLTDQYLEVTEDRNLKESELHRFLERAAALYEVVMQKRKKFVIPPRRQDTELRIRIRTQVNENEGLRRLLSKSVRYSDEDLNFHTEFKNDMKDFCRALLFELDFKNDSSETLDEQIVADDAETKIK